MSAIALDPLIAEARRRTRKRRALWASVALAIALGLGAFLAIRTPWTSPGGRTSVDVRYSYVGVACHSGTSCGRIGVQIWIARPADAVQVTLFGRPAALHSRGYFAYRGGSSGWVWMGFVHVPASRYTPGSWGHRLGVTVRRGGASGSTHLSVFLSPGWG